MHVSTLDIFYITNKYLIIYLNIFSKWVLFLGLALLYEKYPLTFIHKIKIDFNDQAFDFKISQTIFSSTN